MPDHISSVSEIEGFDLLNQEDQAVIKGLLPRVQLKRKEQEELTESLSNKRAKTDAIRKEEIDTFWKIKDRLKRQYPSSMNLGFVFIFNNQSGFGTADELYTRCAEGEM